MRLRVDLIGFSISDGYSNAQPLGLCIVTFTCWYTLTGYAIYSVSDCDLAELQEEIDLICKPNTDPLALTNDMRAVAEKELRETPEIARKNIDALRRLLEGKNFLRPHQQILPYTNTTYLS